MISIVIVGRNDNYGGDFEGRLFATTRYNLDAFAKRGIAHELIFVEWNPLPDRPLLSHKLAAAFDQARCIVVDGAVHRHVSRNRHIAVFEYHAKNVGAWRAQGRWLLLTNPDNYFGRNTLDFLERGGFDPDTLYRTGRIGISDPSALDDPGLCDSDPDAPPPYYFASGDFIFCSKSLFDRVGGFREDLAFTNTHKDSVFCRAAFDLTGQARKIGNTYHLQHMRDDHKKRRLQYDWGKVDRRPQADYGLSGGEVIEKTTERVTMLTLSAALLGEASLRKPPRPRVPRAYRRPRRLRMLVSRLRSLVPWKKGQS
jgi:hypothetical protein